MPRRSRLQVNNDRIIEMLDQSESGDESDLDDLTGGGDGWEEDENDCSDEEPESRNTLQDNEAAPDDVEMGESTQDESIPNGRKRRANPPGTVPDNETDQEDDEMGARSVNPRGTRDSVNDIEDIIDELDSGNEQEESENEVAREPTRSNARFSSRLVRSLDESLNEANYNPMDLPQIKIEHKVILEKKTRNKPEESITWQNHKPVTRGRQSRENIMRTEQGVLGEAQNAETPLECLNLFITKEMIEQLAACTNLAIQNYLENLPEERKTALAENPGKFAWIKKTDPDEILAFLGLCYMRALFKQNYWSIERIFDDTIGHPVFQATMSRNRFNFLSSHLCLDDPNTREIRWRQDRFAAARSFFEQFNDNCSKAVQAGDFTTIDECLYQMRTRIGFKQYNKDKPAKYGMLIKCLNSVRIPYTHRSEVYAGKPVEEGPYTTSSIEEVTLKLVDDYRKDCDMVGRNLTVDNLYTTIPLATKLLQRGITVIGTLRKNKKGIAKEMKSEIGREPFSTETWWEKQRGKLTVTSYAAQTKSKGKKVINVLSTLPPLLGVTKDDGKQKPAIIKVYDFTKGGTDYVDQRCDSSTTNTKSRKWTSKALHFVQDVSRVNAQTVYCLNKGIDPKKYDSWKFGWNLGLSMVIPHMKKRKNLPGIQKTLSLKIDRFLESLQTENLEQGPADDQEGESAGDQNAFGHLDLPVFTHERYGDRRRCAPCLEDVAGTKGYKAKKQKLSWQKTQCQVCGKAVCQGHSVQACLKCAKDLKKKDVEPEAGVDVDT